MPMPSVSAATMLPLRMLAWAAMSRSERVSWEAAAVSRILDLAQTLIMTAWRATWTVKRMAFCEARRAMMRQRRLDSMRESEARSSWRGARRCE